MVNVERRFPNGINEATAKSFYPFSPGAIIPAFRFRIHRLCVAGETEPALGGSGKRRSGIQGSAENGLPPVWRGGRDKATEPPCRAATASCTGCACEAHNAARSRPRQGNGGGENWPGRRICRRTGRSFQPDAHPAGISGATGGKPSGRPAVTRKIRWQLWENVGSGDIS